MPKRKTRSGVALRVSVADEWMRDLLTKYRTLRTMSMSMYGCTWDLPELAVNGFSSKESAELWIMGAAQELGIVDTVTVKWNGRFKRFGETSFVNGNTYVITLSNDWRSDVVIAMHELTHVLMHSTGLGINNHSAAFLESVSAVHTSMMGPAFATLWKIGYAEGQTS